MRRALDLHQEAYESRKLSFGCPVLDSTFGGGLPVHGITEVCGEAGCGKTQLCLQLAVQAMLPVEFGGLAGKACYITSGEGSFPVRRLEQLATLTAQRFQRGPSSGGSGAGGGGGSNDSSGGSSITKKRLLEGVLVHNCPNVDALLELIDTALAQLLAKGEIRLVVIDSVAGAFRNDDNYDSQTRTGNGSSSSSSNGRSKGFGGNLKARTRDLFLFASHLRRLSFAHHTAVVVINQATATGFDRGGYGAPTMPDVNPDLLAAFPGLNIRPALGLSWSTCVNQRIILMRRESGAGSSSTSGGSWCGGQQQQQQQQQQHASSSKRAPTETAAAYADSRARGASSYQGQWRRDAAILLSPCTPFQSTRFVITEVGVTGLMSSVP